ncbi:WD40 repeat domain-containing protein [Streptosporangium sp. NPDC049644]|uniref:WD40 repeat domain-containing protein n=1 Tax=Streptosporangium sp. NPDC049644 TaxID=3155507 RepID=UPI003421AD3A
MAAAITAMAFGQAGFLVVAREDGRIESWNIGSPSTVRVVCDGSEDPVLDLVADGPRILGVSARRVIAWNAAMEVEADHALDHPAHFVTVTPRDVWLAGDSHVARLDRELKGATWTPIADGETTDFDVHPSGRRLVVVKDRVRVRVHDARTGAELHAWDRGGRDGVRQVSVRFTDKPDHLWEAGNRSWRLRRVSAKSGRQTKDRDHRKLASAWAGPLAFSPDRGHLAVLQTGCDVQVWDLEADAAVFYVEPVADRSQEKVLASLSRVPTLASAGPGVLRRSGSRRQPDRDAAVTALAVAERGAMVALGGRDGVVHRCDTVTGAIERLGEPRLLAPPRGAAITQWAGGVAHGVRDGEHWIVREGTLARLDFERPDRMRGVALEDFPALDRSIGRQATLFFRGDLVWHTAWDTLRAWEVATGRLVWHAQTPGPPQIAGDTAYMIDGHYHPRPGFPLLRIDLNTRERMDPRHFAIDEASIDLSVAPVNWPRISAIGPHIVLETYSRPERAFLIDPERCLLLHELPRDIGRDPHDGRHVLHRIPGGYAVIDLENPAAPPRTRRFPDPIGAVHWHREIGTDRVIGWGRDSRRVVVARTSGELLGHFAGHGEEVSAFFVSPDEHTLLSVDHAGFVRAWHLDR